MSEPTEPVKVVVVDDSPADRQRLITMLESSPEVRVVGRASDGEEGLQRVLSLNPDVVTLDLEMPRMDGFTLLRILMSRQPTPVIVVSSHAARDNVFRALEIGALDFIAKPVRHTPDEMNAIREDLLRKVLSVGRLERLAVSRPSGTYAKFEADGSPPAPATTTASRRLVVMVGSTGGVRLLEDLAPSLGKTAAGAAYLVAQPMPAGFPKALATRLARLTSLDVAEADDGAALDPGTLRLAPGDADTTVEAGASGWIARVAPAGGGSSTARLLASAGRAAGSRLLAVVLTGRAEDLGDSLSAIKAAGGRVLVQAPETALVRELPDVALATGHVDAVVRPHEIARALAAFLDTPDADLEGR